ncbi:DNA polymerase III subunit beta [Alicyclobacillus sp. SP_1]|uniref:DNA polymerase III subunit beta n=1 Tax=Alicyclobacillus sp. SP_1 TaxID=2942475 RepID=UPI0021576FDF|nr:DNA polymerase III subunit beta [Alicyclobacillus sp. SP_1]
MKLTVQRDAFLKALREIGPNVIPNSTRGYQNIKIVADKAQARVDVLATNPDATTRVTLWERVAESDVQIADGGAVCVPYRMLHDVVGRSMASLTLEGATSHELYITTGKRELRLSGCDPTLFVAFGNQAQMSAAVTVDAKHLKRLITMVAYAASDQETRPILTGVHGRLDASGFRATATDGMRLSTVLLPLDAKGQTVDRVFPAKLLEVLAKHLPDEEEESVSLEFGDNALTVSWDDDSHRYVMRALDGAYPDTSRILPQSAAHELLLNRVELLQAVEGVAVFSDETYTKVEFDFEADGVRISSRSQQFGSGVDKVSYAECTDVPTYRLLLNAKLLTQFLKQCPGDTVSWQLNGPNHPLVMQPGTAEWQALGLLSPMRQAEQQSA